jgi:hypothetical protein
MIAIVVAAFCFVAAYAAPAAGKSPNRQQITHGEYLVKVIGQCGDCHTPTDEKGELIQAKWLHGTKLNFAPTVPVPNWADTSPNIAGLQGWDHEKAIQFFMTGLAPVIHVFATALKRRRCPAQGRARTKLKARQ